MKRFELSTEEELQITNWAITHKCTRPYVGAIGGRITYQFTPTSLGVVVTQAVCACGEEINVTDYENW